MNDLVWTNAAGPGALGGPGSVVLRLSGAGAGPGVVAQEQSAVTATDFDAVFRASYARLVGVLSAMTNDPDLAADCVQEAFVRAHVRWRTVGGYDDPAGWVRRVALNLVRDHARRDARRRRAQDRLGSERAVDEQAHDPSEQPVDVIGALSLIPPQQRMALVLYYVEGLPVREVARDMRVSEGTVKYHLYSGRERLRRLLESATEAERD
jgi:RNA polymerase sigma factor (sigma-70 family)